MAHRLHPFRHDVEPVRLKLYPSGKVIEIRSNLHTTVLPSVALFWTLDSGWRCSRQ
jgi:hypothetical protein